MTRVEMSHHNVYEVKIYVYNVLEGSVVYGETVFVSQLQM